MMTATPVWGQEETEPRHEVAFDLGWHTLNGDDWNDCQGYAEPSPYYSTPLEQYRALKYETHDKKYTPSLQVQYHRLFRLGHATFAVGATLSYQYESQKRIDRDAQVGGIDTRGGTYLNMLLSGRYYPLYRPQVRIYTELHIGRGHWWESDYMGAIDSSSHTLFHVTIFGLSVGKRVFGFGEFGVGHLGLLRTGIGYRF